MSTFRSADDALLRQKEGGRDTGENRRSPLQLEELLLLQKLPQLRSLFLALSFGTFHILLLPGAGVSHLGLILDILTVLFNHIEVKAEHCFFFFFGCRHDPISGFLFGT